MTTDAAVELAGVTKRFGDVVALDRVDLRVPSGVIFGFLGPNGAGKTTTIRLLTGLARPTSGEVRVLGREVTSAGFEVSSRVGYLPDVPAFYEWMTGEEYLAFVASLFGLESSVAKKRAGVLLEAAGLAGVRTRIGGYSRGMKQRLGIAQALMNAPALLVLDEPTSALDPIGRKEVLDMIEALAGKATVFFSTHILSDAERVCDEVAILDRGRVVANASVDEIRSRAGRKVALEVAGDVERVERAVAAAAWCRGVTRIGARIEAAVSDPGSAQRDVPAIVAAAGAGLVRFETVEPTLEDVFVELVERAS
ncbi:ABC transporter ATP-binding protein [Coriobacteriia bacterium Es71-Z0120]|uniref:ABC transporter ATP-binding protein n=1 Tax=Parvivirga hydrogeniphila TaxID=2939460 RepID=UPI0022610494|nr:ABC transporter ATP-binding protein [Parvivirga hydrogeniphila]MCL4079700.1 ABC transporter ATP-binding protein [Parvivirga hydrogeniphila]